MKDFCSLIENKTKDSAGQWGYRTALYQAAGIASSDSAEQRRTKMQRAWQLYVADLRCSGGGFDVPNGSILKFAVFHKFAEFLADVRAWGIDMNKVDPCDQRTVLDYIIDQSNANRGSDMELWHNDQYDLFYEAGARRAAELTCAANAGKITRRFTLPNARSVCAFVGAALLILGVSAPALEVPIFGAISYFQYGKLQAGVILALASAAVIAAALKAFRWLWVAGLGTCATLLSTMYEFHSSLAETKAQVDTQLAGHPFKEVAAAGIESVHLEWGWAVLAVGALLVLIAAAVRTGRT